MCSVGCTYMMTSVRSPILKLISKITRGWMLQRIIQCCDSLSLDAGADSTVVREHAGDFGGSGLKHPLTITAADMTDGDPYHA